MIRRYCDCCGEEITEKNRVDGNHRIMAEIKPKNLKLSKLSVEVITAKNNTWNDGDFCKYCIIDAIKSVDDRPIEVCEYVREGLYFRRTVMNKPEFKVGDRVWHPEFGWCVVHDYDHSMKTTHAYWCYINLKKYYRWFGWWELFYDEVELPNPPKPEPEIDWSKVPVGTRVLVRDFGREYWEEAKFLAFVPEHEKFTFWVDRDAGNATGWQQCRLASDVEVKEEWLR